MSPAHTGQHRRTRTPAASSALGEVRRLRALLDTTAAELADVMAERDELRAMLVYEWWAAGEPGPWELLKAAIGEDWQAGPLDVDQPEPWPTRPDPELMAKRWGPGLEDCPAHGESCNGRLHFADSRPGDFPGRGAAVEAMAS